MADFSMPIEKPGEKRNFSAAGRPWQKKEAQKNSSSSANKIAPNAFKAFVRPRVPSSVSQMDAQNTKAKENLTVIKMRATPKDKKVSKEEQERLKFYKVKFFKK